MLVTLNSDLENLIAAPQAAPIPDATPSTPKGWEPGVRMEPTGVRIVTTPQMPVAGGEEEWRKAVESLGIEIPEGWSVRVVEMRYDPAAWHRDEEGGDAVTRPVWRYRFAVEPHITRDDADWQDIREMIKSYRRGEREVPTGDSAFVVVTGDLQIGKSDGDGSSGTVKRFLDGTTAAVYRLRELRRTGRKVGVVYLIWPGDCIEGFNSQGGRLAWRNDLTLTEQIRVVRRLMIAQVRAFAPLAEKVVLVSVPGNHDEAVRTGDKQSTRFDDSFAVDAAVSVADALDLNPEMFSHCSVVTVAPDELVLTLDICGTIVTVAHGHQFRKSAMDWWAKQAHGMQTAGRATLLISGHFHHLRVEQSGAKTWLQTPALDGGSTWFRHSAGVEAPPGTMTLMVGGGAWSDLALL